MVTIINHCHHRIGILQLGKYSYNVSRHMYTKTPKIILKEHLINWKNINLIRSQVSTIADFPSQIKRHIKTGGRPMLTLSETSQRKIDEIKMQVYIDHVLAEIKLSKSQKLVNK
jgi:small-conductance mechanosensitive channel